LSRRRGTVVALAAAAAAGVAVAALALAGTRALGRLPLWDEAANLWGAAELWAALADGRLLEAAARLNAQDKWPFGFSLALLPLVALGGGAREVAVLLPAAAFAAVAPLLVWAGGEVDRGARGIAGGALAGALWLAAPLSRALATVVLRETTGAALSVALLGAWLAARRRGDLRAWRRAGLILLALCLVKPNYALLAGAALALHAAADAGAQRRRELGARLRREVFGAGWRAPARWAALVLALAVLSLAAGRNPGGLLYGALVVSTLAIVGARGRSLLRPEAALARLGAPARALVETFVVPLWLWCLSPDPIHPRNVIAFLVNRESTFAGSGLESAAFYPRVLAEQFAPAAGLGWTLVALAVAGLGAALRRSGPPRALALVAGVGVALVALHPMREPRFVATVAPAVLLLAVRAAGGPLALAAGRGRAGARFAGAASALALAAAAPLAWMGAGAGRLEADHRSLTGDAAFRGALDDLVARVSAAPRQAGARIGLLGVSNELSDALVRWEAWRASGREAPLLPPLRGLDAGDAPARVRARLGRWLERGRPARIVTVRPRPRGALAASEDYRRWNAWQREALAALGEDAAWRPRHRRRHPGAQVEITTWVRAGTRAPARG
jgi:hypothetical protein